MLYFEDGFGGVGERAARGKDGKTYYVPADMTYKEWHKAFVNGDKSGLQEHIEKNSVFDIIELIETKEVIEVHSIGRINRNIYKCITDDIVTDEVIITDTQIKHILDKHPDAYNKIMGCFNDALKSPDFIIADKHPNTGLVIKGIKRDGEYLQLVLRICTSNDKKGYKNSVISCWNISEKRLKNYIRNKKILYKNE